MHFVESIDQAALYWYTTAHPRPPWLTHLLDGITRVGNGPVVVSVGAVVALIALLARQPRLALLLLLVMALAVTVTEGTKRTIRRSRPDVAFVALPAATSNSFPSGHATLSMAVFGSIALAVCNRLTSRARQVLVLLGAGVLILAIGYSRLYLGVHYVTDVVAGWCAGGAVAMLFLWLDWQWACKPRSSAGSLSLAATPVMVKPPPPAPSEHVQPAEARDRFTSP